MVKLTRAQRKSLYRIYCRHIQSSDQPISYREFRKQVVPELCGWEAVLVQVPGMWIGIEPDGHAHT